MPERDPFDKMLDETLCTYAEPAAGLENRILGGLETSTARTRRLRLVWAIALPLAACAVFALSVFLRTPHTRVQVVQAPASSTPLPGPRKSAQPLPAPGVPLRRTRTTPSQRTPQTPKLDQFPAPSPLTAQEQALIRFVENAQPTEQIAIANAQHKIAEPLHVAAIQIPPIKPPAEGDE